MEKLVLIFIFMVSASFASLAINKINSADQTLKVISSTVSKYKIGDVVKCSQWPNESFWEGKVVNIIKEKVYQIQLQKVVVKGQAKLYLNKSDCTGKKQLSYEDGEDFNKTKIWIHERCLD